MDTQQKQTELNGCETCFFSHRLTPEYHLICRRFPPQTFFAVGWETVVVEAKGKQLKEVDRYANVAMRPSSMFTIVRSTDWCGEFQRRAGA